MATKPKYNTNCCVVGCHSKRSLDRTVHFHFVPKKDSGSVRIINALGIEEKIDRRAAWEKALQSGKPVTDGMRVCSKHFTIEDYCARGVQLVRPKLKKCAVPSLNLPECSQTPD